MDSVTITEFDKDKNIAENVSDSIFKALTFLKDKSLLITNRNTNLNFIDVFADSLYNYERGIVLLERFFKKDKCRQKGEQFKTITEEEKQLVQDFATFSINIPDSSTLTEKEQDEYTAKIQEFENKISDIHPRIQLLDSYKYDDLNLVELSLMPDEQLKMISDMYAGFSISLLSSLTWSSLAGMSFGVKTIEYDDNIDLILIPIKADN